MNAVGCFVFAGAFTEGVKKHFEIDAHLEGSAYGVATSRLNHPGVAIFQAKDKWPLGFLNEQRVDFFYANPPCAPWSAAGSKNAYKREFVGGVDPKDPRVQCWHDALNAIVEIDPTIAVVESVTRCWTKGQEFVLGCCAKMRTHGYASTVVLHDGYDCGVAQHRKRVFVCFHKVAFNPRRPTSDAIRTPRAVLAGFTDDPNDRPNMWAIEAECLKQTPEGGKTRDAYNEIYGDSRWDPKRKVMAGRPGFLRKRLWWDKPSGALTGGAVIYHPEEDRFITVAEMAALCGYPQHYDFVGSLNGRYAQVAQAVMPPVGEWIAREAKAALTNRVELLSVGIEPVVLDYLKEA